MLPISEANFIVIDVETTGSNSTENRITDVACISVKNFKIDNDNTLCSLVNPHQSIPWYIRNMTGITDKMTKNAPEPMSVFNKVLNLLQQENTFFVAHNANFDYLFIKETMKRLCIPFEDIPVICSLKLAKKILPANIKKNVGDISKYFNIPIIHRHRAFDDAYATANFFIEMLCIIRDRYGISDAYELLEFQNINTKQIPKRTKHLTSKLNKYKEVIPNQSGVLEFIGKKGNMLYVTKASNMIEQIDYFTEQCLNSVKNVKKILNEFNRLDWNETKNELETIITEYRKIKQHKPKYNFFSPIDLVNANDITINEETKKRLTEKSSKIVVLGNSERERNVDVYLIKKGMYQTSSTIGCKADISDILNDVHNIYFTDNTDNDIEIDINEMNFISNWLDKNTSICKTIEITNILTEDVLFDKVESMIRNFYNVTSDIEIQ